MAARAKPVRHLREEISSLSRSYQYVRLEEETARVIIKFFENRLSVYNRAIRVIEIYPESRVDYELE